MTKNQARLKSAVMVIAMFRFFRILPFSLVAISMIVLQCFAENPVGRPVKYATEYDWSTIPAEALGQPGAKTVNLAACPPGRKRKRARILGPY